MGLFDKKYRTSEGLLSEEGIKELESKLLQTGIRFRIYKADVSDFNTIKEVFADATDFFGGVSVLFNNA